MFDIEDEVCYWQVGNVNCQFFLQQPFNYFYIISLIQIESKKNQEMVD